MVHQLTTIAVKSFSVRASRYLIGPCLFVLLTLVGGCVTANFTQPIASFQQSVNTSSAAIGAYYTNMNNFERQLYLDNRALDPQKEVGITYNDYDDPSRKGEPTPLLGGPFDAASIKARMDALTLMGVYAQRLTDLAGSSAPEDFQTGATTLGQNLSKLDQTFSNLSGSGKDSTAANYVGPISALIGSIGKMVLASQRDQGIREAVDQGAPQVNAILDLIEADLVDVVKPTQTTGLQEQLASRTSYYNKQNRATMDLQERRDLLREINNFAAAYEAAVAFNPSSLIQSMRQANQALVVYADSPKVPENLNAFVSALATFNENAQEVLVQVQTIRQATGVK